VRKESIVAFLNWLLNERKLRSTGVVSWLGSLCAAMRWNPTYKDLDLSWFRPLLSQIPPEPESEKRERKGHKYLPYGEVAEIPRLLRRDREGATHAAPRRVAAAVRDELIMSWLVILPWRQRNIRECQLGHNLFKAKLSPLDTIARPLWVRERLRANPNEEFWQFHFREKETKTGGEVRSILPRRLVALLEEYLQQYRPVLLRGKDPGTLFVSQLGRRFTDQTLTELVSTLTLRYKTRRVTPHIFRDIVAYWWSERYPQDYLTLSKLLWHRDINTTLRIYGGRFDESNGVMRMEECLDEVESRDQECRPTGVTGHVKVVNDFGSRYPVTSGSDYEAQYLEQLKISHQLAERAEQLEKQLSHQTLEPHAEQSQPNLEIQPTNFNNLRSRSILKFPTSTRKRTNR
jgi:integrase